MVLPSPLRDQEHPASHLQHDNPSALQHDADIPVRGTEEERTEAKQAEAKEEALKSLCPWALYRSPASCLSLRSE